MERVSVPVEEGLTNTPADNTKTSRPSWLPDKFSSEEDMAKSYAELEREYTKLRQAQKPEARGKPQTPTGKEDVNDAFTNEDQQDGKPTEGDKPATVGDVKSVLPGFTEDQIVEFSNTAWENGALTDDQYSSLEKAGYSRQIVDQFIQGQMALVEGQRASLVNAGGGEENVEAMFAWAAKALSPGEITQYNTKFDNGGPDALMAMEHLKSRYDNSGVALPSGGFVQGANAPRGETGVYTSMAQVVKDMQSEQYKQDPAFRKHVSDKLSRSNVM